MLKTLSYTVAVGCCAVAGLIGCGPTVEPEQTSSPQGPTAQQEMDQEYQKRAEEMQKMQEQMRRGRGR
jgi:hypothetical protein